MVLFGTDVGFTKIYDTTLEYELMHRALSAEVQVLALLTTNPAQYFNAAKKGRVERGFDGDLVVLDGDPMADVRNLARVAYTIRGVDDLSIRGLEPLFLRNCLTCGHLRLPRPTRRLRGEDADHHSPCCCAAPPCRCLRAATFHSARRLAIHSAAAATSATAQDRGSGGAADGSRCRAKIICRRRVRPFGDRITTCRTKAPLLGSVRATVGSIRAPAPIAGSLDPGREFIIQVVGGRVFRTQLGHRVSSEKCHVWTAPSWQELFSRFAALVGAAMCSAFQCGSHDRWP